MRKEKYYSRAISSSDVVEEAYSVFRELVLDEHKERLDNNSCLTVETSGGDWHHDTEEEFFDDCRKESRNAVYEKDAGIDFKFRIQTSTSDTSIQIGLPQLSKIEKVYDIFERHLKASTLPEPEIETTSPRVFVGHGQSLYWRDLKDHLQDQHGYEVVAYEVGARSGHTILGN